MEDRTKLAFSIREAVAASSLSKNTIYRHIAAGRLQANKVGGRTLIPSDSLRALVSGEA
jgi:excisionase family DNA binding protein